MSLYVQIKIQILNGFYQTPYPSVLDFSKSLFHEIDFWTWFLNMIFCLFGTWFLMATQAVKIKFEIHKNQVQKLSSKLISWNKDLKKSSTDR